MSRRSCWVVCVVALSLTADAQELPSQASDLTLSAEQKKPLLEGRSSLDAQVKALVAACGPMDVVLDWEVYVQVNKARGPLDPKHMWRYAKRCGGAIDAVREACQQPRQQVTNRVNYLKCRYMEEPKAPSGGKPGEWEPLIAAKELYIDFNDTSNDVHDTIAAFMAKHYPPLGEPNFLGETAEQHRAIESELNFLNRDLKETNAKCGAKLTSIIDYEGIQDGKPKSPSAKSGLRPGAVERVDSMVSEYFSRCRGSIQQLARFCSADDAAKAVVQKKLTHFECRYEATREGFGDSKAQCPIKVERGGLVATCTWYQRSDWHGSIAMALGVKDPFKSTSESRAAEREVQEEFANQPKRPMKESCLPHKCIEQLGPRGICRANKCIMGLKLKGEACKHYGECRANMACVRGVCTH